MPQGLMRDVVYQATFGDACGGLIRFIGDAQRFGFRLQTLVLADEEGGIATAIVALSIPLELDADAVAMRFARHPEITCVPV